VISNLTLALSIFTDNNVHAPSISKDHPTHYQVYYRVDGKNRVMMVPKSQVDYEQLQFEVGVLLSRNLEEQHRIGKNDGNKVKTH
jgi:hypothetical protein